MFTRLRQYLLKLISRPALPTVRYTFSFLFLLLALVGVASVIAKDGSYIRLSVPATIIKEGNTFSIDVYAYASTPVNAVDLSVKFSAVAVEVIGIDTGESVITLWTQEPYVDGESVVMRGGTYRKGFIGEHRIATINLKAKTTGKAEFLVNQSTLLAGDGQGTPIKVNRDGVITTVQIYSADANVDTLSINTTLAMVADLNNDGQITMSDISMFMSSWYGAGPAHDLNNDGKMTFKDFSIILAAWFRK